MLCLHLFFYAFIIDARDLGVRNRGIFMDDKHYLSFKVALGVLFVATIILFLVNKNKSEAIVSGAATIVVGIILGYFKLVDFLDKRHEKQRRMHLDK